MQPVLLPRFRDVVATMGSDARHATSMVLASSRRHMVRYVPFEHVTATASIVIVGITPGPNQIVESYDAARKAISAGLTDDAILAEAKRVGAFGGPAMRPNLVRLLEAYGIPDVLGVPSAADLWQDSSHLLHATSVVPHAAFAMTGGVECKPFNGSFDDVRGDPVLRQMYEEHFIPSLASLPEDALFIALGRTPEAALRDCIERGLVRRDHFLGSFPHPATTSGSQVDVYLGLKSPDSLDPNDPVRKRVNWLLHAANGMHESTRRLGGGRGTSLPPLSAAQKLEEQKQPAKVVAVRAHVEPEVTKASDRRSVISFEAHEDVVVRGAESLGYEWSDRNKKLLKLIRSGGKPAYLIRERRSVTIAVDPCLKAVAEYAADAVRATHGGVKKHSGFAGFPSRNDESPHGLTFVFRTPGDAVTFLGTL